MISKIGAAGSNRRVVSEGREVIERKKSLNIRELRIMK
jgi:hypothetical protein